MPDSSGSIVLDGVFVREGCFCIDGDVKERVRARDRHDNRMEERRVKGEGRKDKRWEMGDGRKGIISASF